MWRPKFGEKRVLNFSCKGTIQPSPESPEKIFMQRSKGMAAAIQFGSASICRQAKRIQDFGTNTWNGNEYASSGSIPSIQGTISFPTKAEHKLEQRQFPSSQLDIVENRPSATECYTTSTCSGEISDSRKPLRRTRALLTAETAREVFKLRGRLAASEGGGGIFPSLFTARSILVSKVLVCHFTQCTQINPTTRPTLRRCWHLNRVSSLIHHEPINLK